MEPEEPPKSNQEEEKPFIEPNPEQKILDFIPIKEKEDLSEQPIQEEDKILGKKTKKEGPKKINRELCSICRDGGNLLLCDYCPRSFHIECLKLKEESIPEGKWYCPMCAQKIQKRL